MYSNNIGCVFDPNPELRNALLHHITTLCCSEYAGLLKHPLQQQIMKSVKVNLVCGPTKLTFANLCTDTVITALITLLTYSAVNMLSKGQLHLQASFGTKPKPNGKKNCITRTVNLKVALIPISESCECNSFSFYNEKNDVTQTVSYQSYKPVLMPPELFFFSNQALSLLYFKVLNILHSSD